MLSRLIASARSVAAGAGAVRALLPSGRHAATVAPVPETERDFPPMRPLEPPAAQNDDVLRPVHEVVERDLRARGYLR